LAILSINPGSQVLDIGSADGSVARILVERECRVFGVEADERAAAEATRYCERVVVADVEGLDLDAAFGGAKFDVVLLLDVLEHLRDPSTVLNRAKGVLASGGEMIASIPNVTHASVRLSLLRGTFRYSDTGILDRTHLRFFDKDAVEALFKDSGLHIRECLRVRRGLTETEIAIDPTAFSQGTLDEIARDPESTTYQFVVTAIPAEYPAGHRVDTLAETLQQRLFIMTDQFRQVEAYARSLEAVASLTDARELRSELTARMEELRIANVELHHLKADLLVKEAFLSQLREQLQAPPPPASLLWRTVRTVGAPFRRFPRFHSAVRALFR
jgi:2-polyprenyl-3-methyl-5-hydroxy-6-metoxy-1,4-benzoquinol methylase